MRPTLLKMKAFGSYAEETSVNFNDFTGGLYLIVGGTGAGKTTIFDAISFALFGRPSGSERTADMMHSDFVPLSEDTVVTLDFVHLGRSYHVVRSLHFSKKRGSDEYNPAKVTAVMTGDGQTPIENASQVTARCEELLGLNAEQFRRIVMLAQGEFREFLRAGSDKKNEILGRLFDNTEYVRYQTLLDSARVSLRQQRKAREDEIASVMANLFRMPEGAEGQEAEAYLPGHPRLVDNLEALVLRDQERLRQLHEENEIRLRELQELSGREGAAEAANSQLQELAEKREHLSSLEAQKDAYAARKQSWRAAEKALHHVRPKEDDFLRAARVLDDTRRRVAVQETLLQQHQAALDEARAATAGDTEKQSRADVLNGNAVRLREILPDYQTARTKDAELRQMQKNLEAAENAVRTLKERKAALAGELETVRKALTDLFNCDAEAERLKAEWKTAHDRWQAAAAPGEGVAAQVEAIRAEERALESEKDHLARLARDASDAENRYHNLYQAFLAGQAGLIAMGMEKELSENGRAVCPVCSTAFRRGEPHRFALPAERVPDKTAVDGAEKTARNAELKRQKKAADIENAANLLEHRKNIAVQQVRKLAPECGSWDELTAPGWLPSLCTALEHACSEKERAYGKAKERSERRAQLLDEEAKRNEALQGAADRLEKEEPRCQNLKLDCQGLRSTVELIRKKLPFPEEAEAQIKLAQFTGARDALLKEIQAHTDAVARAQETLTRTAGSLKTLKDAIPGQEQDLAAAKAKLAEVLSETGFADMDAARAALPPVGDRDGESWLVQEKEALDDYGRDLKNTRERIEALVLQTEGKSFTDLTELKAQLEEAGSRQAQAAAAESDHRSILRGHQTVLEKVAAAKTGLAGTDDAWRRVSRLADLAVGVNSDGGKLSFDRYVMGAIFREVLEMANRRLNIMTGGRFELVHSVDAGRKNAVAGLEIEVLDVALGKQRPSASISGGEGFMVSLALALGLSDVVQNHAGGKKLDTLFIDEGFGTLDDGRLDNVITVLNQLTEGNRLVGIISHVDKLEESIPQKLRVKRGSNGSTLVPEVS